MLDFTNILDIADKMNNLFKKLKDTFAANKDAAAEKLNIVVMEISKIYAAIDQELVKFLTLTFEKNESNAEERTTLLTLQGPALSQRVNDARGHRHKIMRIYDSYLDKWFNKIFTQQENDEIKHLFELLNDADNGMVNAINDLEYWMHDKAGSVQTN